MLSVIQQRRGYFVAPLRLQWCPAHLLERVHSYDLTGEEALSAGSNKNDIVLNRLADHHAKDQIADLAKSIKADLQLKHADIFARQLWFSKMNRVCKKPDTPAEPKPRRVALLLRSSCALDGRGTVMLLPIRGIGVCSLAQTWLSVEDQIFLLPTSRPCCSSAIPCDGN